MKKCIIGHSSMSDIPAKRWNKIFDKNNVWKGLNSIDKATYRKTKRKFNYQPPEIDFIKKVSQ